MAEHRAGQRLAERHQDDGPVNRMEAHDVLADDVQIGRPELFIRIARAVGVIADGSDIVGKRIDPDIDDVPVVKIHGDSPLEGAARHTEVLQPGTEEVIDHLVPARSGNDKILVRFDVCKQPVLVFGKAQEICLLARAGNRRAAIGAAAVHNLRVGPEGFAGLAVVALIRALVDVALLVELSEYFLHHPFVLWVGRTDEPVIGHAERIPDRADLTRHAVDIRLGRDAGLGRTVLDLLPMLVGAGEEKHVLAALALIARDRVGQYRLVHVADMRLLRSIGNGCGYIKFFFHVVILRSPVYFVRFRSRLKKSPSSFADSSSIWPPETAQV